MHRMSDNYYLRKKYFKNGKTPTVSVMMDHMGPALAKVYVKSMTARLNRVVNIEEPPVKGGGELWMMSPEELLAGRAVLKPANTMVLKEFGYDGLMKLGRKMRTKEFLYQEKKKRQSIQNDDLMWQRDTQDLITEAYKDLSKIHIRQNKTKVLEAICEFENLYRTSINNIESAIVEAAANEVHQIREEACEHMKQLYAVKMDQQVLQINTKYDTQLEKLKVKKKEKFIRELEELQTKTRNTVHDINVEKHLTEEKLQQLFRSQNLACQIYTALKEREECQKEKRTTERKHKKVIQNLKDQITATELKIKWEESQHFNNRGGEKMWKAKVCHVIKSLLVFIEYCLRSLPRHAEFFLNMEKLMISQLTEAINTPHSKSIIEYESEFKAPEPAPHPFYLFCDKGYKAHPEPALCPEHKTSSASQLPVIVINKRCIYSACDNFDLMEDEMDKIFTKKEGDDIYTEKDKNNKLEISVNELLQEFCVEDSVILIHPEESLGKEQKLDGFVDSVRSSTISENQNSSNSISEDKNVSEYPQTEHSVEKVQTAKVRLRFLQESMLDSYFDYIVPKHCKCAKIAKTHVKQCLPAYMRMTSPYEGPQLPHYEECRLEMINMLVNQSKGVSTSPQRVIKVDAFTQYSDQEFDKLCECFSNHKVLEVIKKVSKSSELQDQCCLDSESSSLNSPKTPGSFISNMTGSVKSIIDCDPELRDILNILKYGSVEK